MVSFLPYAYIWVLFLGFMTAAVLGGWARAWWYWSWICCWVELSSAVSTCDTTDPTLSLISSGFALSRRFSCSNGTEKALRVDSLSMEAFRYSNRFKNRISLVDGRTGWLPPMADCAPSTEPRVTENLSGRSRCSWLPLKNDLEPCLVVAVRVPPRVLLEGFIRLGRFVGSAAPLPVISTVEYCAGFGSCGVLTLET